MCSVDSPAPGGNEPPALNFVANDSTFCIPITDLHDPDAVQALVDHLARAAGDITVELIPLLECSHEDRFAALSFVAQQGFNWLYVGAGDPSNDLLGVMLSLIPETDEHQRHERGRRAAIEVVALTCADCLHPACDRVLRHLRELGVKGLRLERLLAETEKLILALRQPQDHIGLVAAVFPSADAPPNLILPQGWGLNGDNQLAKTGSTITISPMLLLKRLVNEETGTEWVELSWPRDGVWRRKTVPRRQIACAKDIIALTDHGLPVTTNNAASVVDYLSGFERVNLLAIPRGRVVDRFGWLDENCAEFLWSNQLFSASAIDQYDTTSELLADPSSWGGRSVEFRAADEGNEQLARGLRSAGTLAGWCELVAELADLPVLMAVIAAALAAPLLRLLNVANFGFSTVGPTSTGKTTALQLGAGVWGCPSQEQAASIMHTWDTTAVAIQRTAAMTSDMPIYLDETKRVRGLENVAKTLYDLTSGCERGRGSTSTRGLQHVASFRTVVIMSGEESVSGYTQDGGARARVLEFWHPPFENTNPETAELVRAVRAATMQHYGHAGPAFVRWLLANRKDLASWQAQYSEIRAELQRTAVSTPVAGRMAESYALLVLAARLATSAGLLGRRDSGAAAESMVLSLWPEVSAESHQADRATAALEYVVSWWHGHPDSFWHAAGVGSPTAPHGGWAGALIPPSPGRIASDGAVGFLPHKLEELLAAKGFQADAILRAWLAKGWLATNPDRKRLRVRAFGRQPDMVAIRISAITEVLGPDVVD